MTDTSCLSTRTEKFCKHCGEELCLVEPTDVLASRPIEVDLICPTCHGHCRAELTVEQLFRSIFPHLIDVSPPQHASNDNDWARSEEAWSNTGRMPHLRHSEPPPSGMLH